MAFDVTSFVDMLNGGGGYGSPSAGIEGAPWEEIGNIPELNIPQLPDAPNLSTDPSQFLSLMDQINGRIGGAYDFDMPQAETAMLNGAPQAALSQFGTSPELQSLLSGEGFSPQTLAMMRTQAREAPAMAGRQQMGQMKRILGQSGIEGPAAAAMMGDVARNTGYSQGQNLQDVEVGNAMQAAKNKQFGVGMQTNIGMSNMQQANMMALQNANMMFESLRANQNAQNSMNQFNTGAKQNQEMQRAGQQGSYAANAGGQLQGDMNARDMENANMDFGRMMTQGQMDFQGAVMPWQEQNNRTSQSVGTLGSWGA